MKKSGEELKQIQNSKQIDTNVFMAVAGEVTEGVLIITDRERHVYANKRAAEMTGYSISELLGMTIGELMCFHDLDIIKEKYLCSSVREDILNLRQAVITRKDGTMMTTEMTIIRTIWHREPATLLIMRSVNEQDQDVTIQNTEKAIMITSQVGSAPMIVSRLQDGLIGYVNKRFGNLLGLPLDTLVGSFARNYLFDANDCLRFFAALKERGRIQNFEIRFKKADGATDLTIFSGQPLVLQDAQKWFIGVQVVGEHRLDTIDNIPGIDDKPVYKRVFKTGDIIIDLNQCVAAIGDHKVYLTATECRLLTCLGRNAGSVVTYDRLLKSVWGGRYQGDEQLLHTNVCRIRRKMHNIAKDNLSIITKHGMGYMLTDGKKVPFL